MLEYRGFRIPESIEDVNKLYLDSNPHTVHLPTIFALGENRMAIHIPLTVENVKNEPGLFDNARNIFTSHIDHYLRSSI